MAKEYPPYKPGKPVATLGRPDHVGLHVAKDEDGDETLSTTDYSAGAGRVGQSAGDEPTRNFDPKDDVQIGGAS